MSHREVWNMIINSRQVWPYGHFLHDLDVYVYTAMAVLVGIAILVYEDWRYCRKERKLKIAYQAAVEDGRETEEGTLKFFVFTAFPGTIIVTVAVVLMMPVGIVMLLLLP